MQSVPHKYLSGLSGPSEPDRAGAEATQTDELQAKQAEDVEIDSFLRATYEPTVEDATGGLAGTGMDVAETFRRGAVQLDGNILTPLRSRAASFRRNTHTRVAAVVRRQPSGESKQQEQDEFDHELDA